MMLLSTLIREAPGVKDAAILMGTLNNKKRLESSGFSNLELNLAESNDLCIGLYVADERALVGAEKVMEDFLTGSYMRQGMDGARQHNRPRSLEGALRTFGKPNLICISLPGQYAANEARKAIENNLHVFMFSNNVSIEDEAELKRLAYLSGLLMMGPDCGTALIGQIPLGFCNKVSPGAVGIVGASGTGSQEVMCLLNQLGVGISHVIGTGGRDLHAAVGALTSKLALRALEADESTRVIIYISKPAVENKYHQILDLIKTLSKPVVVCFIGGAPKSLGSQQNWLLADNLNHAAHTAAAIIGNEQLPKNVNIEKFQEYHYDELSLVIHKLSPNQHYIRGLFSGGSLASESAQILAGMLPKVSADHSSKDVLSIHNLDHSEGHTILDMGQAVFTQGRPHPIIDLRARIDRFWKEARDPEVALILLDVVLGTNAHPNPAAQFATEIRKAKEEASSQNRYLPVIVHVCGTDQDPQNRESQVDQFREAGCLVFNSNLEATIAAGSLIRRLTSQQ